VELGFTELIQLELEQLPRRCISITLLLVLHHRRRL
jgi:hypothetical protein